MTKKIKDMTPEERSQLPRIRVQFDLTYTGTPGEVNLEPSMTVPDMNLTVRQMLDNYMRSGDPGAVEVGEPMYFDMEIPTFEDFADVQAHREFLEKQVAAVDEWIEANKEAEDVEAKEGVDEPTTEEVPGSNPVSTTTE